MPQQEIFLICLNKSRVNFMEIFFKLSIPVKIRVFIERKRFPKVCKINILQSYCLHSLLMSQKPYFPNSFFTQTLIRAIRFFFIIILSDLKIMKTFNYLVQYRDQAYSNIRQTPKRQKSFRTFCAFNVVSNTSSNSC